MNFRAIYRYLCSFVGVTVSTLAILGLTLVAGKNFTAKADSDDSRVLYNSIPHPIPPNAASEGPEAYAYSQLGDGVMLAGPAGGTLDKVTVVMSSWACTSGNWFTPGTCVTTPGATFTLPITVNIYSVITGTSLEGDASSPAPGTLLATRTENFAVPYRPSGDTVNCPGGQWFDKKAQTCFNGFASPITFDLASLNVKLPKQVIVGFQFNSTDYGPNPIGSAPCRSTIEGCFYDSLNLSTDSNSGFYQAIGSVLDVDGIFFNYTLPGNSCNGAAATGVFGLDVDPGCWTGFHPEMRITAKRQDDEKEHKHGDR